jgi:signal transduction histidine kinase
MLCRMPIRMPPLDTFPALTRRRSSTGADELQFQALGGQTVNDDAISSHEPPLNLTFAGHLLLPVAIFAVSLLTIEFSRLSNLVATLWPSNAIMLVALLRYVRSPTNCISIFVSGSAATALAGALSGNSAALCATLSVANFVEVATALVFLRTFQIDASNLTSFRNLLIFIVIAGGIAPISSALIGAVAFGSSYGIPWVAVWRNWYPGHALGMIIVAPFLISVTSSEFHALRVKQRAAEAATVLMLIVAVAIGVSFFRSMLFLTAPIILFTTARFGLIGATIATFVIALTASAFVVAGIGQPVLPQPVLSERIFALQIFLAITSFWSLPTAALLTERDRLLDDLSRANSRLTAESERKSHLVIGLRRHLSMAEENERLRLSHELHDQAGQSLMAAILELNQIDTLISDTARERLHSVRKKMEEMGKTLHRIAWELRPPSIDELGLRKALASYIADWGEQCGTDSDFHCDDPKLDEVPSEVGTAIYRIVQEGLTNIVKHARQPSSVSVVIRRVDAMLHVIIEDNGCGFDVGAATAKGRNHHGLGLDGMRERLSLIGGTLEIESALGTGTTIFARITLDGQRSAA